MCRLKKTGLIWLLIHYYYGGDAPPPGPAAEPTPGPTSRLAPRHDYRQKAIASVAFSFHGVAMRTAFLRSVCSVNFMR